MIEEIALEDAISRLECDWDTPRVAFSGEFWRLPNLEDPKHPKDGVYAMLKNFKPTGAAKGGGRAPERISAGHRHDQRS